MRRLHDDDAMQWLSCDAAGWRKRDVSTTTKRRVPWRK